MFKIIRNHSKRRLQQKTDAIKLRRREILRVVEGYVLCPEYKQVVVEQTAIEEEIYDQVSRVVLDELGLSGDDFQRSQEQYMTQPSYQNRFFASIQQNTVKENQVLEAKS